MCCEILSYVLIMTEGGQDFDPELLNVLTRKNGLKDYLKSLDHLNEKMSKDATNYANLSSIAKGRLASFKVGLFKMFFPNFVPTSELCLFYKKIHCNHIKNCKIVVQW